MFCDVSSYLKTYVIILNKSASFPLSILIVIIGFHKFDVINFFILDLAVLLVDISIHISRLIVTLFLIIAKMIL